MAGETELPSPTPSASFGSSSTHVVKRCRGAVGTLIELAALGEISVETSGPAEAENSAPHQKLFPRISSPHNVWLQIWPIR